MHAAIEIPQGAIGNFSGLRISPDGRTIVYGGNNNGGQLFRRRMDGAAADAIPGAEAAYHPFLSPDGESSTPGASRGTRQPAISCSGRISRCGLRR
jgi:WD40-like Beta Propeller Repeat